MIHNNIIIAKELCHLRFYGYTAEPISTKFGMDIAGSVSRTLTLYSSTSRAKPLAATSYKINSKITLLHFHREIPHYKIYGCKRLLIYDGRHLKS